MKNIQNLILNNFQQWKKGTITFTKGLNVLVGNTECGKSTLFRAISSILTGKMPEDYIRKGCKDVEVKINFNDNTYFRRFRSKKDNIADANGLVFERVGKDIPFEYFKKLGKTNIEFGSKELSLCLYSQFEPHFFITLSNYDKSKLIGTICGIDIVDKLVDSINKDIRSDNSEIKFLKEQNSTKNTELQLKEENLVKVKEKVDKLQIIVNSLINNYKTLENLSNLKNKRVLLENDINTYKAKEIKNKTILDNFKGLNTNKLEKLLKFRQNLHIFDKLQNDYSVVLVKNNKLKQISFPQNLEKLLNLKQKLVKYNKEITNKESIFQNNKILIDNLNKEKNNLLKDFDKCPLCGGIING